MYRSFFLIETNLGFCFETKYICKYYVGRTVATLAGDPAEQNREADA
jgi:hypothetical protein